MRERSAVVSYGYLTKDMASQKKYTASPAILNYSTFEEQFLKENKRNVKPRHDKQRRCSDVESDTGSDGLAINSGGSGRSGDWTPSRRRVKGKPTKNRSDSRPSLTDSGISLSKEDSESFSEFTLQSSHGEVRSERIFDTTSSAPSKNGVSSTRRISVRRSSSLSALPSNIKALDRHNPRLSVDTHDEKWRKVSVEEQEDAILKQCYENEGVLATTEYSNENGRSYIFDCSQPFPQSKFPLPDHLNYPLCKYRFKSESILNRSPIKPFKKLKTGWKKLKSRRATQSQTDQVNTNERSSGTFSSALTYLEYLSEDEEDSETILARLETNANQSKSFIKKLFGKVGGKSYTANDSIDEDQYVPPRESSFQRSGSTRSIPEALKDMWTKVHDVDSTIEERMPKMSRAISMPSLSMSISTQREFPSNATYFSEIPHNPTQRQQNYFSNFFKPIESSVKQSQTIKARLAGGNDVITGILGQSSKEDDREEEDKQGDETLVDAKLTSISDQIETMCMNNAQHTDNMNAAYHKYHEHNRHFPQQHIYASSYDLSPGKSHFYNPQTFYSPHMQPIIYGHCGCCMQPFPYQYGYPYYPAPNYVYEDYHGYRNATLPHTSINNERFFKERGNRDSVVIAPLDVQMSIERKAERRKIAEMVFDTFV